MVTSGLTSQPLSTEARPRLCPILVDDPGCLIVRTMSASSPHLP
jgi:hypothetical protein